jgi:hypothetical protein
MAHAEDHAAESGNGIIPVYNARGLIPGRACDDFGSLCELGGKITMKLLAWLGLRLLACFCVGSLASGGTHAGQYKNFRVAVYIPVGVVEQMRDPHWLQNSWDTISSQLKVDKVYIETYRSGRTADEQLIEQVKKFFRDHGTAVAGGIAFTSDESRQFQSFSYTDPKQREFVKQISEMTARHFDEIILDDFFFNMTKTDSDIAAKGTKSWTQFRLEMMDAVSRDLVVGPAKTANQKVKVIIKFPNWYEHFQGLGYDLAEEPKIFDGIYTGTETRDPVATDQHLQQYESYEIFRYFENIKPGGNGGGWVDTFSLLYLDRYAEQLWDTMFAKAPELMLFNWYALLQAARPGDRDVWKGEKTSFDYDQMVAAPHSSPAVPEPTMARAAGYSLEQVDSFLGELGKPIGLKSYKPLQSTGEDFLHNYLGMLGIPIDLYPYFPSDANVVLLTESTGFDPDIVSKIKEQLQAGKNVVITSGLLHALQGRGIEDIVELRYTGHKVAVRDYSVGFGAGNGQGVSDAISPGILFPEIRFLTNDAWALVRGMANGNGFPILLMNHYSKGTLFVLTIPENFNDLYDLPPPVLAAIKDFILADFPIRLEGPSRMSLFAYDNNTFIVESFLDKEASVSVSVTGGFSNLKNLVTGEVVHGEPVPLRPWQRTPSSNQRIRFQLIVKPHSYLVLAEEK